MSTDTPVYADALGLPLVHAGKVRELYELPDQPEALLMVATDAISAYDHVLPSVIPDKGAILNQMSLWWFDKLGGLVDNHVISTDVPEPVAGRAVIVERLEMIPVECVARGYLTGSGFAEYQQSLSVCGVRLPEGLDDGDQLSEPIFTPATKALQGEHDENVDYDTVASLVGNNTATRIRQLTLDLYTRAEEIARHGGLLIADTKFEFGRRPDGEIVLADEVLTPDSSRFWSVTGWPEKLESFDKQFLRDWLTHDSGWDRAGDTPPPALPEEIVMATRERYLEAFHRLTGEHFTS